MIILINSSLVILRCWHCRWIQGDAEPPSGSSVRSCSSGDTGQCVVLLFAWVFSRFCARGCVNAFSPLVQCCQGWPVAPPWPWPCRKHTRLLSLFILHRKLNELWVIIISNGGTPNVVPQCTICVWTPMIFSISIPCVQVRALNSHFPRQCFCSVFFLSKALWESCVYFWVLHSIHLCCACSEMA